MAWGDPQDYWWLRRTGEQPNRLQGWAQLAQQQRQQQMAMQIREKEAGLQAQKTGLELVEYFNKKELQNTQLAGNAALAKALAEIKDRTSPDYPRAIMNIGMQYPEIVNTEHYQGALKMYETAVKEKNSLERFNEGWAARERIATEQAEAREKIAREQIKGRADVARDQIEGRLDIEEIRARDREQMRADTKAYRDEMIKVRRERIASDERFRLPTARRIEYETEMEAAKEKFLDGAFLPEGADTILPSAAHQKVAAKAYDVERARINQKYLGGSGGGAGGGGVGTRGNPHKPSSLEDAAKIPVGEFFVTPDGRVIQRE